MARLTLKKSLVDPESTVPYFISVCLDRSSADSMGDCIRSTVRNAVDINKTNTFMNAYKYFKFICGRYYRHT